MILLGLVVLPLLTELIQLQEQVVIHRRCTLVFGCLIASTSSRFVHYSCIQLTLGDQVSLNVVERVLSNGSFLLFLRLFAALLHPRFLETNGLLRHLEIWLLLLLLSWILGE